jgi:hypothetical protein
MSSNKIELAEYSALERAVLQALRGLRYASVEVVVHDGRAVQIERREKVRLEPSAPGDDRPPHERRRK